MNEVGMLDCPSSPCILNEPAQVSCVQFLTRCWHCCELRPNGCSLWHLQTQRSQRRPLDGWRSLQSDVSLTPERSLRWIAELSHARPIRNSPPVLEQKGSSHGHGSHRSKHTLVQKQERGTGGWDVMWSVSCVRDIVHILLGVRFSVSFLVVAAVIADDSRWRASVWRTRGSSRRLTPPASLL